MEMGWLHSHGLISSYEEYVRLPAGVLADAQALMKAEAVAEERRARGG